MNILPICLLVLGLLAPLSALRADDKTPQARPDPARFLADIAKFDAADKEHPPATGGIVFTGSSSVRLWDVARAFPGLPVLNRGFGGSVANDLAVHAEKVILRYQPKVLVIYTGSNDLHGRPAAPALTGLTPKEALADYTRVLNLVHERLPRTRVIVSSVKVSPSRVTEMNEVNRLNALLEAWCQDKPWIRWVEATRHLIGDDGQPITALYRADRLHLSDEGYAKWNAIIGPVIREEWERAGK